MNYDMEHQDVFLTALNAEYDMEHLDLFLNTLNAEAGRYLYDNPHLYELLIRAQTVITLLREEIQNGI